MRRKNDRNERLKREYADHLTHARGRSESTIDDALAAILRFEDHIRFRDFKAYRPEQAQSFKQKLVTAPNPKTGHPLSAATRVGILNHLRAFFLWARERPGFKRITVGDCEYFTPSRADETVAATSRPKVVPTLDQVRAVLKAMPDETPMDKRDRALVAFLAFTAARADAIASLKLRHVNVEVGYVDQEGRDVRTKFRKTFRTYFVRVGDDILKVFGDYVAYLRQELLWGPEDPLFPPTEVALGPDRRFRPVGVSRRGWADSEPVRRIVKPAFDRVGLPYPSPHRFRDMLTQIGERVCRSPEEFKAWSQNIGHDGVLTTFMSYGSVPTYRQGEIISRLGVEPGHDISSDAVAKLLAAIKQQGG